MVNLLTCFAAMTDDPSKTSFTFSIPSNPQGSPAGADSTPVVAPAPTPPKFALPASLIVPKIQASSTDDDSKRELPSSPVVPDSVQAAQVDEAQLLFSGYWRNPNRCHFLGKLAPRTRHFSNVAVGGGIKVAQLAKRLCGEGSDVYLAVAEYGSSESRTQANAVGAYGFWVDIDCGEQKAAEGKGYATIEEALAAVDSFCKATGLPKPNITVNSGGGIHVHWILTDLVLKEPWQAYAKKFKALAAKFGFLADPSRTADIASVMRIPGTMNRKYDPPKPVALLHASKDFIETEKMLAAIQTAYEKHVASAPAEINRAPTQRAANVPVESDDEAKWYGPPDLAKLVSALKTLDPDCEEYTWKFSSPCPVGERRTPVP